MRSGSVRGLMLNTFALFEIISEARLEQTDHLLRMRQLRTQRITVLHRDPPHYP